jgi:mono/diheme cytochrome c family protein
MPLGHFDQHGGENLYRAICQGCHMPDARGAQGAAQYPALAANPRLATAAYPAAMVLAGRRAMPPLGGSLSDEQIAEVVNYVRSHFDNRYADTITPDEVERLRASLTSASKSP